MRLDAHGPPGDGKCGAEGGNGMATASFAKLRRPLLPMLRVSCPPDFEAKKQQGNLEMGSHQAAGSCIGSHDLPRSLSSLLTWL